MKYLTWFVAILVLLIIGGGAWVYMSSSDETQQAPEAAEMPTGAGSSATLPVNEDSALEAAVAVEEATLAAIAPYTGSGSATRSFNGQTFSHTVTANIADPAPGKFYEGWLVMPTPSGPNFFSTGKMNKSGNGYNLIYSANQNYPEHVNVVITEETLSQGLDNNPEAHVLEGSFN